MSKKVLLTIITIVATVAPALAQSIGEKGTIKEECLAGVDKQNYDELLKTIIAKDEYGAKELLLAHKCCTLTKNTKVLVIGYDGFLSCLRKVRVLSGPGTGTAWIVPVESVSVPKVVAKKEGK